MIDLTGFRAFDLDGLEQAYGAVVRQPLHLIRACQLRHTGFVDGRRPNAGALALAEWLLSQEAKNPKFLSAPRRGDHPLNSGTLIDRILACDVVPDAAFADALAVMTDGAVRPDMFAKISVCSSSVAGDWPPEPVADEAVSQAAGSHPASAAPSIGSDAIVDAEVGDPVPPIGMFGRAAPAGRLFHPIADASAPDGFVLAGGGVMIWLDGDAARAMRAAIDVGIAHVEAGRAAPAQGRSAAA